KNRNRYGKENQDNVTINDKQNDLTELDTAPIQLSVKAAGKRPAASSVTIADDTSSQPIRIDSKLNPNIQSTFNKLVEEQLEQRTVINTLQEEIKCKILENHMILQNILKILMAKDIKNMWLDVPMTKACHKLFQENKNPSDSEIEQAFKLQIQNDYSQKMQELVNSNGWDDLWNAAYSV
ncbi:5175_t:CDS:2, partial [Funneliformis caledonium]